MVLQVNSKFSFLRAFSTEIWVLLGIAVLACGLSYGIATFVNSKIVEIPGTSQERTLIHHINVACLFAVGGCFQQGVYQNKLRIVVGHINC